MWQSGGFLWYQGLGWHAQSKSVTMVVDVSCDRKCHSPPHFLAFDRVGLCVFGTIPGCRRIFLVVNSRQPPVKEKGVKTGWLFNLLACLDCVLRVQLF